MNLAQTRIRPSTVKLLAQHGIVTVADLRRHTDTELLALKGFGRRHLTDVRGSAVFHGAYAGEMA